MGASQAADRIAWAPYSRKTLAIARELATLENSATIGCDHLLTGLVRLGRGVAATVLSDADLHRTTFDDAARTRSASSSAPDEVNTEHLE